MTMDSVCGKVAVVMGVALGIRETACIPPALEGAQAAVPDIHDEAGERVVSEITSKSGAAEYWHMDVSDRKAAATTFADADRTFGELDLLVNNAGISGPQTPGDEAAEEDANGVFPCTKYCAPYLNKAWGGSIINLSSIYGLVSAATALNPATVSIGFR